MIYGGRGGVSSLSLYVSNVLKSKVIHTCTITFPTIETQFIEIIKENCKLLIISIYQPPRANAILYIDKLSKLLSIISGDGFDEIILFWDFNVDILNHDNNRNTLNRIDSLLSQSFIPIITKPSLITNQTETLIDNIFITKPSRFVSGILISKLSDHLPLFNYSKAKPVYKEILTTKLKCEILSNQWLYQNKSVAISTSSWPGSYYVIR